jgi:tRNA A-37 threonylcarbamoyl transferase component Bud32
LPLVITNTSTTTKTSFTADFKELNTDLINKEEEEEASVVTSASDTDSSQKKTATAQKAANNNNIKKHRLNFILNRTLSDSILNKKSSSNSNFRMQFLHTTTTSSNNSSAVNSLAVNNSNFSSRREMGLSRKNSTHRRSIYYPISIFHHSSSNILNKTNPSFSSQVTSPNCNFNSSSATSQQVRAQNRQKLQHHRSSICVINSSTSSNNNNNNQEGNNSLSPSPVTMQHLHQSPLFRLASTTPPKTTMKTATLASNKNPLILCHQNSSSNLAQNNSSGLSSSSCRLTESQSKLQLTPAASTSFSQRLALPSNQHHLQQQSLLSTSNKTLDARRWSFASMHSSSGYGTNTPPPNCGDLSTSNQSSQYSSNEKLLQQTAKKQPQVLTTTTTVPKQQQQQQLEQKSEFLEPRVSLCGNLNCQNCSNLVGYNHLDCLSSKISEATHAYLFQDRRSRLSSSNDSSQLDDSSETGGAGGFSSPVSFHRQRARSLSCSPSKAHNESDIILLHNEKFKEKFPKACTQMEENLQLFVDSNKDLNLNLDPAARFIYNQIIEQAKLCLDKSKQNQLTCYYFDEMTGSCDKLLLGAAEKSAYCEYLQTFVKKFLLIVSRVARLLECLEFDPLEFCQLLDAAEEQARHIVKTDIPKYIIEKLGLNRDPYEEMIYQDNFSGLSSLGSVGSASSTTSMSLPCDMPKAAAASLMTKRESTPSEEDFEEIKLISNGAYGAVYLVRHKQLVEERFAMKKIKKHNLVLRNQLQQVFTERDIMTFTDNPFVVALICTFETKKYLCMVMEYVEGGDVATLIKNMGPLPLDMARTYFAETTLAVEYLHNYGIIHRDLKPDNLLITCLGHIKLTDFGLSKVGLMNLTTNFYEGNDYKEFNDKQICGTPQYLAPEVVFCLVLF